MQIIKGDLWGYHSEGWKIVISTNIGWGARIYSRCNTEHANNMGAGIAYQAWMRWPWLPDWLGSHYRALHRAGMKQRPVELDALRLIFVPVKPLKVEDPAYSWDQKASLDLIREQLGMLSEHQGKIALGFVGCGNGALHQNVVLPSLLKLELVRKHKGHGETVVVDRDAELGGRWGQ